MNNYSKFLLSVFALDAESTLSLKTRNELKQRFKTQSFKKGTIINDPEYQKASNIAYLRKGLVRGFVELNGKEVTNWITIENELFASANFFYEDLFIERIEAIEDIIIEYLDQRDYEYLMTFDDFNLLAQRLFTKYYVWANRRALIARIPNSKTRLEFFLKNYNNDIINRCPNKYLAEFLGIRPETMSRLLKSK